MEDKKIKQLKKYLKDKNVRQAILFGSHARGTESKKSDYDLIIIQETEKRFFDRYEYFDGLYSIMDNCLDMLIYTPAEWESIKHRIFFRKIMSEAKIIYVG